MTARNNQRAKLATALAHLPLWITTSSMHPQAVWPVGCIPFLVEWIAGARRLRSASPKWVAVWRAVFLIRLGLSGGGVVQ